jgi:ectoine hydroxylase-related dioxygenase (phytanoyl-CoA dioxygenase family)
MQTAVTIGKAGYAIYERIFERHEMERAIETLDDAVLARTRAGARHLLAVPAVHELAANPRLLHLARRFVGDGATAFRATLFDKSGESNWLVGWHQDTVLPLRNRFEDRRWGPWSVKAGVMCARAPASALGDVVALRLHLDDSTALNGPLRVLPGTHNRGILTAAEIEEVARDVAAVDCLASAGGVVAMRPLLVHASSKVKDGQPRRVLHIEYARTLRIEPGAELAVI